MKRRMRFQADFAKAVPPRESSDPDAVRRALSRPAVPVASHVASHVLVPEAAKAVAPSKPKAVAPSKPKAVARSSAPRRSGQRRDGQQQLNVRVTQQLFARLDRAVERTGVPRVSIVALALAELFQRLGV